MLTSRKTISDIHTRSWYIQARSAREAAQEVSRQRRMPDGGSRLKSSVLAQASLESSTRGERCFAKEFLCYLANSNNSCWICAIRENLTNSCYFCRYLSH